MRKTYFTVFLLCITCFCRAQRPYFQQDLRYQIEVTLQDTTRGPEANTLQATELLTYLNHSPDTLRYIYFHLWMNAYRNGSTPFAKQKIESGELDFYNARPEEFGHIKILEWTADGRSCTFGKDSLQLDTTRIILPRPLLPGDSVHFEIRFTDYLPKTFSRGGHEGQSYQLSQWYPKPAVYDAYGWHPMPYLDQGEFYSEYGSYDVRIHLPENYTVGSTGDLQPDCAAEINRLNQLDAYTRNHFGLPANTLYPSLNYSQVQVPQTDSFPLSSSSRKTLHYRQQKVHDFAWFADKRFYVLEDHVSLPGSGRTVKTWVMFLADDAHAWQKANQYINDAVSYYSQWIGDYPYNQATALEGALTAGGGMEYPNVTVIGHVGSGSALDEVIAHEVGHNWFYGIFGFNERDHPWMDEGINSYYENRYMETKYAEAGSRSLFKLLSGIPDWKHRDENYFTYLFSASNHTDQPLDLPATAYTSTNYGTIVYAKTPGVMLLLEKSLGTPVFDSLMHQFFEERKFTHVYPDDMRLFFERHTHKNFDWLFDDELHTLAPLDYKISGGRDTIHIGNSAFYELNIRNKYSTRAPYSISSVEDGKVVQTIWYGGFKGLMPVLFPAGNYDALVVDANREIPELNRKNNILRMHGIFRQTERLHFQFLTSLPRANRTQVFVNPLVAWNSYDHAMIGLAIHNLSVFGKHFQYAFAPLYSLSLGKFEGTAKVQFNFFPQKVAHKIYLSSCYAQFHTGLAAYDHPEDVDLACKWKNVLHVDFQPQRWRSTLRQSLEWSNTLLWQRSYSWVEFYYLGEFGNAQYFSEFLPRRQRSDYMRLDYLLNNTRVINPFYLKARLEFNAIQEGFLSYHDLHAPVEGCKGSLEFGYTITYHRKGTGLSMRLFAGAAFWNAWNTSGYHLNGTTGIADYAFDETFLGRSETTGIWSHQLNMEEGEMKYNSDLEILSLGTGQGIVSLNLKSTLPAYQVLPLFLFADLGYCPSGFPVYSSIQGDGGIGIRLFKGLAEIYWPVVFSNDIRLNLNSLPEFNAPLKRIFFDIHFSSIDLFNLAERIKI